MLRIRFVRATEDGFACRFDSLDRKLSFTINHKSLEGLEELALQLHDNTTRFDAPRALVEWELNRIDRLFRLAAVEAFKRSRALSPVLA